MPTENKSRQSEDKKGGFVSIEKAILLDVCLGVPLGRIWLRTPASKEGKKLPSGPKTTLFRGEQLGLLKEQYLEGDAEMVDAMAALTEMAESALKKGPFSVTHKSSLPLSGDPHDYYSLAKYWWPNDASEDGKAYVRRDGFVNPDCYGVQYDFTELEQFSETVLILSLAAYLTDKPEYGKHASRLLTVWFLDESTRQNPSFEYAQAVPGKKAGGWQGIIEARRFINVTESVHLLETVDMLSAEPSRGVRNWFAKFLDWMAESANGKEAAAAKNNIGFWYDLQRMVYADFCGQNKLVAEIATKVTIPRLDEQLAEDGSLPAELDRAYPQDYVAFTVMAMALISRMGEKHSLSLWEPTKADGRGFRVAHDWLRRLGDSQQVLTKVIKPFEQSGDGQSTESGNRGRANRGGATVAQLIDLGIQLRGVAQIAETRGKQIQQLRKGKVDGEQTEHLKNRIELLEGRTKRWSELNSELKEALKDSDDGIKETLRLWKRGNEHHQAQRELLEGELDRVRNELQQLRKEHQDTLRAIEADRQREQEALQHAHEKEKRYLQAQIDAANAMAERLTRQEAELKEQLREAQEQARRKAAEPRESSSKALERELDYLRAQLDTANAMWGWYAVRAGDAGPSTDISSASSAGNIASIKKRHDDREKSRSTKPKVAVQGSKDGARKGHNRSEDLSRDRGGQYNELVAYAEKLEKQYAALLSSKSWRIPGGARVLKRWLRRIIGAKVPGRNQWPSRPGVMNLQSAHVDQDALCERITDDDMQAIRRYALALEEKITALVNSTSWKVTVPIRVVGRAYRRVLLRRPAHRTRLPKRPKGF